MSNETLLALGIATSLFAMLLSVLCIALLHAWHGRFFDMKDTLSGLSISDTLSKERQKDLAVEIDALKKLVSESLGMVEPGYYMESINPATKEREIIKVDKDGACAYCQLGACRAHGKMETLWGVDQAVKEADDLLAEVLPDGRR
jgi:hypothetical protein